MTTDLIRVANLVPPAVNQSTSEDKKHEKKKTIDRGLDREEDR